MLVRVNILFHVQKDTTKQQQMLLFAHFAIWEEFAHKLDFLLLIIIVKQAGIAQMGLPHSLQITNSVLSEIIAQLSQLLLQTVLSEHSILLLK